MDSKRMAEILNGRPYREEITKEQAEVAKECGLVVIFWCSDDLVEFRWAIDDEIWAWDHTKFRIDKDKNIMWDWDFDEIESDVVRKVFDKHYENSALFIADFDQDWYSWTISTKIPHETFEIEDDWEKYCKWIVFNIKDL